MSLSETPTSAPKKPRRKPRRAKPRKAAANPKPSGQFSGLTAVDCPSGCNVNGCVISGKAYCGHPYKGGLQGRDLHNDAAVARMDEAKKMLGKAKITVAKSSA